MNKPARPTNCGKLRKCGGNRNEGNLHIVAAGVEKVFAFKGADYRFLGTTAFVPARAGVWTGAGVPARGKRKLPSVHGAGSDRDDGAVHFDFFRNRAVVGPAVRIFERDSGGSRTEIAGDGGANARRSDCGDDSGNADCCGVSHLRVSYSEACEAATGISVHGADCDGVCGTGDFDRVEFAGYAGIPADYEFSGAAHLFSFWSTVSTGQSSNRAGHRDAPRPSVLRCGWIARSTDQREPFRSGYGPCSAFRRGGAFPLFGRVAFFED